ATRRSRRAIPARRGASRGVPSLRSDKAAETRDVPAGGTGDPASPRIDALQTARLVALPNAFDAVLAKVAVPVTGALTSPKMRASPPRFTTTTSTCRIDCAGSDVGF